MSKQTKTKQGAASIYIVMFTSMLLSVIVLGFVNLMLSESTRTVNYSLSQSAYNSALAGVEDAKIVLLNYQSCVTSGWKTQSGSKSSCDEYKEAFSKSDASENCDLVSTLLYGKDASANGETVIQSQIDGTVGEKVSETAKSFDQAYTCVKVSQKSDDFITKLTANYPSKIIPVRTDQTVSQQDVKAIDQITRVKLSWFSRSDASTISTGTNTYSSPFKAFNTTGTLATNKVGYSPANGFSNSFGSSSAITVPPAIQVTLIQTAANFKLSQFYTNDGQYTNRGTLLLRPTTSNVSTYKNGTQFVDGNPFAASANKGFNNPIDIHCDLSGSNEYACSAEIYVPKPIATNGNNHNRNDSTMFFVVNIPYGLPETEVNVQLLHCEGDSAANKITDENCNDVVKFYEVQPVVDSTGRASDLFRRVQARVEMTDTYFPIINYALAVEGDNNDGYIQKNFYITKNCYASTYENGQFQEKGCNDFEDDGKDGE